MLRNLDLTALRSFVTVADLGGVTKAATKLNITQSAVSMQLKRMEEFLGFAIMERSSRKIELTAKGELLLSYARRMLELNDECWGRMAGAEFEGELSFGVPYDIVYPHIPNVLKQFSALYPNIKVNLSSSLTRELKADYAAGKLDLIMTTENQPDTGGYKLADLDLAWVGAPDGKAWRKRPLPLATHNNCIFWPATKAAVEGAGIPWELALDSANDMVVSASVNADLAIAVRLKDFPAHRLSIIDHKGELPELPSFQANIYMREEGATQYLRELNDMVRQTYASVQKPTMLKAV